MLLSREMNFFLSSVCSSIQMEKHNELISFQVYFICFRQKKKEEQESIDSEYESTSNIFRSKTSLQHEKKLTNLMPGDAPLYWGRSKRRHEVILHNWGWEMRGGWCLSFPMESQNIQVILHILRLYLSDESALAKVFLRVSE